MLVVRIAEPSARRPDSDLTARARIRDAAVRCFAEDGFDVPFRTIAGRAGVSPGLITHHFGSKAALRAACDTHVLRSYQAVKQDGIDRPSAHLLGGLTDPGVSATLLVYIVRAVHAGGPAANSFLEHLIADMRPVMAAGVESGLVRPSRDEEARLRYLTYQTIGALMVRFVTMPGTTPEEFVAAMRDPSSDSILPTLELFTEGVLADRALLDDYLHFLESPATWGDEPPARPAEPEAISVAADPLPARSS